MVRGDMVGEDMSSVSHFWDGNYGVVHYYHNNYHTSCLFTNQSIYALAKYYKAWYGLIAKE